MTENFYSNLSAFRQFRNCSSFQDYNPLPKDWFVFVTDVKGSTSAIEAGKYKDVNMVGVASITACLSVLGSIEIPFVFGGDGASLCVPPKFKDIIAEELAQVSLLAEQRFELNLRVACIPAIDIFMKGESVLVGKFEICPGRSIACFSGGGLAIADKMAKENYDQYKVAKTNALTSSIENLSCRWQPIPNRKGAILSVIVAAQNTSDLLIYDEVLSKIETILGGSIELANPVHVNQMTYEPTIKNLKQQKKQQANMLSIAFLKQISEIFLVVLIRYLPFLDRFIGFSKYVASMPEHSDYRKFDDMIRFVIDCSSKEKDEIEDCLRHLHEKQSIYYGIHKSDSALMTCMVESLQPGGHLHFIDGAGGGYAMAAKILKKQIAAGAEANSAPV